MPPDVNIISGGGRGEGDMEGREEGGVMCYHERYSLSVPSDFTESIWATLSLASTIHRDGGKIDDE